ncbi:MAG TPA: alpha/beta fold hydrolase [Solirubrobacteraceae bacterium]|nr:alpha/beta fold hydrolase [Solirubrobacteraceae bacterium]
METIRLPQGTVRYRVAGPPETSAPPVVFVHGLLVSGSLWTATADALAGHGVRSYAPDWPLGAHTIALAPDADVSPAGVARMILGFLEALDLRDVTLVGNDTGGALCQLAIDTDPARVGRVVLTNCDAFEQFPPPPFGVLVAALRHPGLTRALMLPMRSTAVRHSLAAYGPLVRRPLDPQQTRAWVEPILGDAGVRRDVARFAAGVGADVLRPASERLTSFPGAALIVWGTGDRFFKLSLGQRLAQTFARGRLVELQGARTFVPHDEPERLAQEIAAFAAPGAAGAERSEPLSRSGSGSPGTA